MHRKHRGALRIGLLAACLLTFYVGGEAASAQRTTAGTSDTVAAIHEIHAVMDAQVAAWNRGNVMEFMRSYKDSPDTTFVSDHVAKGYQAILARYRKKYDSKAQMGTVRFTDIEVRPLCPEYASVTGQFHLTRSAAAGGNASGVFSLLFQRTRQGWRIILDHTS